MMLRLQNRLNAAMMAIEDNQLKKLKNLIDSDLVEARNTEVSSLLIFCFAKVINIA